LFETPGFCRFHAAELIPPAQVIRFTDIQELQHGSHIFTGIQHRIRITQLADKPLGILTFSLLVHQKFPASKGR
tara:strand:+ start:17600 stop:17821 length:222 start_codon:yes stop_codon:yes gene_type:complete